MLIAILGFILCAGLIFYSGAKLSRYGDIIAGHLGWAKSWVGLVLMASVTSLPELIVGVTSAGVIGSADLALGDVMGSCAFNLGILALLDVFDPKKALFSKASSEHALAGAMSIILIALVGIGLYLPDELVLIPWIGFTSILFIVVYFVSIHILYRYELKLHPASPERREENATVSFKRAVVLYAANALVVIGAAVFLPHFAETLAEETGLGQSFVGTLFLAASTSFPEVAVTVAAMRMGLWDMAVGSLLGSNIFNILILAIDDLVYTDGFLLKDGSDSHIVSVFSVIIMTAIVIAALMYRREKKRFFLAWDALLVFSIYVLNLLVLYYLSS